MKIRILIRLVLVIIILATISSIVSGQNCSCISGTKDKKKGIEWIGGVTNSVDSYSLLIQKEINYIDTTVVSKYILSLTAPSRVMLTDSMLKTVGVFELKLLDSAIIILDNVKYYNNPMGFRYALGFSACLTRDQIKALSQNPIATITVKGILATTFAPKKQKEQQTIFTCLINRKQNRPITN